MLTLLDEREKLPVFGRVMRITRAGGEGSRQTRMGIEFSDEDVSITAKIENYLSGYLTAERDNHTL